MQKFGITVCLALVMLLALAGSANAQATLPAGGCPNGFMLMSVMEHDTMEHNHIGLHVDVNMDGYLCMKHVTATNHVHTDNFAVLP